MAILIDPPAWPAHGTLWSHLVSDRSFDELHAFAARLPIPRRSFDLDHYDVPVSLYEQAIAFGAQMITAKELVHRLRASGLRVRQVDRGTVAPVRRRQYLASEWVGLGRSFGLECAGRAGRARHAGFVGHTDRARAANPGCSRGTSDSWDAWIDLGDNLLGRWNEAHRSYHDARHLEDVLLALNHLGLRGERIRPETLLAAWFHDAVYTGHGDQDELDSAQLAARSLECFPLETGVAALVSDFIIHTTPERLVEDPPTPLAHLLDADLSIFASSPNRYEQYTSAVRTEYAHVADSDFALGRSQILRSYLEQPTIYRTSVAQQLWEDRARRNLTQEVEMLRLG